MLVQIKGGYDLPDFFRFFLSTWSLLPGLNVDIFLRLTQLPPPRSYFKLLPPFLGVVVQAKTIVYAIIVLKNAVYDLKFYILIKI